MSENIPTRDTLPLKKALAIGAATVAFALEPTAIAFQADEQARQDMASSMVGLDLAVMGAAGMVAFAKRAAETNQAHITQHTSDVHTYTVPMPPNQR